MKLAYLGIVFLFLWVVWLLYLRWGRSSGSSAQHGDYLRKYKNGDYLSELYLALVSLPRGERETLASIQRCLSIQFRGHRNEITANLMLIEKIIREDFGQGDFCVILMRKQHRKKIRAYLKSIPESEEMLPLFNALMELPFVSRESESQVSLALQSTLKNLKRDKINTSLATLTRMLSTDLPEVKFSVVIRRDQLVLPKE